MVLDEMSVIQAIFNLKSAIGFTTETRSAQRIKGLWKKAASISNHPHAMVR
jgi:hypothetical protein